MLKQERLCVCYTNCTLYMWDMCNIWYTNKQIHPELIFYCSHSVGRSGEDESQEDVLMDEAPSNISQTSTLQANREGKTGTSEPGVFFSW